LLPVDIQLHLFDVIVLPILLYGVEIWGFEKVTTIEKLYLKFLKIVLKVNNNTCSNMVYGELGRFPIDIYIQTRMVTFWARLLNGNQSKISVQLYRLMYKLDKSSCQYKFQWFNSIKSILNNVGLGYVWNDQNPVNVKWLKYQVFLTLKDQFVQKWRSEVWHSGKCINYRIFKSDFTFENYLLHLPENLRVKYTRFRCRNHKLPIEIGAHTGVARENRKCTKCNLGEIGDEFHYIYKCKAFLTERKKFLKEENLKTPSTYNYNKLFNNVKSVINLALFVKHIMKIMEN
jgi:hypothetical protein